MDYAPCGGDSTMITESDGLSKGYSPHANAVENDRELSARERSVYDRILHKADRKTGRARFNYDRITELEECSPRTLARAFAKLERRGHISRKFTGRGYILYVTAISGPKPEAVESRQTRRVDKAESGRSALTPVAGQSGQRRLGQEIRAAMGVHSALTPVSTLLDKNSSNKKDYMHEETSANMQIEQLGMSANKQIEQIMHKEQLAIKQLSMPASNLCNSRQEEEVSEKLEEEDSFKNFGRHDGMRDLLAQVSMNHIPKFHILTSVEHDEQDGKGDSLRESISFRPNLNHSSYSNSSIPPDSSLRSSSESCCFCKNHRKLKEVLDESKDQCFGIYGELGLRALCHFLAEDISFSPSGLDVEKHHAQAENFLSQVQTRLSLDEWYSMTLPEFNRARGIWGESDPDPTSDLSELDKYVSMIHVHDEPDLDLSDSISSTNTPELVGSK